MLISIVIPVYRSEQTLMPLMERLHNVLLGQKRIFEVIFVDDGSPDSSWKVLQAIKAKYSSAKVKIVRLLKNSGQHNAILCGLTLVQGDIIVTMDDDLQNPPEEIPKLLAAVEAGFDLAIGAYEEKRDMKLRNIGGSCVDSLLRTIFKLPKDFQLTSFRAMRKTVVDHVVAMGSVFPYITAMLLSHAGNYTNVFVRHDPRTVGVSNYTLKRSFYLAFNLILNYSPYPLYIVFFLCFLAFGTSVGLGGFVLYKALFYDISAPGWASTMLVISFFNGLILLALLILSFYISRITQQLTRSKVSFIIGEIDE
jgi:glycosyltransferase involved in cell wall biosynthesis